MGYPGNKGNDGVYHSIINQIPPHKYYVELFLGSGQIMRKKLPAPRGSTGVEINADVIKAQDWTELQKAYRIQIHNSDAIAYVETILKTAQSTMPETFMYLDPPYPISSRRNMNDLYEHELNDRDHIRLLKALRKLRCSIAISTYENPIYKKLLHDWRVVKFKTQTHRGTATELLYMNYPEPTQLHDYRYLGKDFTDRQRIKRKIDRHVQRLMKLPSLERAAICNAIFKNNSDII